MAGIYLHIPFCHSKCAYCDFYSLGSLKHAERLVDALSAEFEMRKAEICGKPVHTIYFGGGTPSILPSEILHKAFSSLPVSDAQEITLEANPEDVTPEQAAKWFDMGINRVSMGVQSMVDGELQIIGRRHTSQQAADAVATLRAAGFANYNLDLIYGLPGQDLDSWKYSVDHVIELNPTHVSAYSLTYEPRTRLSVMLRQGKVRQMDDDIIIALYGYLCHRLREAGYKHYEISNWAKQGFQAMHNSNYWTGETYLGLGPSAHSFDGSIRRINPANLAKYLQLIESRRPAYEIDTENDDNRFNDSLITALRTDAGLDMDALDHARRRQLMLDAKPFVDSGVLSVNGSRLRFNEESWLISDYVMERLIQIS